jgi:mono/diheme cytochrome c family protein
VEEKMPTRSKTTWLAPALALAFAVAPPRQARAGTAEGEAVFTGKCAACHTIGKGKLVGPDLAGVTERRDAAWLRRQIKTPDQLLAEGDPIATQLVKDMNGVQMVPLGLTDAEVESVIEYLGGASSARAPAGAPPELLPALLVGVVGALGLTALALGAARKQVDVR